MGDSPPVSEVIPIGRSQASEANGQHRNSPSLVKSPIQSRKRKRKRTDSDEIPSVDVDGIRSTFIADTIRDFASQPGHKSTPRKIQYATQFLANFGKQQPPQDLTRFWSGLSPPSEDRTCRAFFLRKASTNAESPLAICLTEVMLAVEVVLWTFGRELENLREIGTVTKEPWNDLYSSYRRGLTYLKLAKVAGLGILAIIDTSVQSLINQRRLTDELEWLLHRTLKQYPDLITLCNGHDRAIEQQLAQAFQLCDFDVTECAKVLTQYEIRHDLLHDGRSNGGVPSWEETAAALVAMTPRGRDLLHNDQGVFDMIRDSRLSLGLLDGTLRTPPCGETTMPSDEESLKRITTYAEVTMSKGTADLASFVNIRHFLVYFCCAELRRTGVSVPDERIFQIVRLCAGHVEDLECESLLQSAIYLYDLVDTLRNNRWGERVIELLLIWNRPLKYYIPLTHSREVSLAYLTKAISTPEYTTVPVKSPSLPFSIPSLLHSICGERIHVAQTRLPLTKKHAQRLLDCIQEGHEGLILLFPEDYSTYPPFIRLPRGICTLIFGETLSYCKQDRDLTTPSMITRRASSQPLTIAAANALLAAIEDGCNDAEVRVPRANLIPFIRLSHALCVQLMKRYTTDEVGPP